MIKTILVDDEKSNPNILSEILKKYCPAVSVCATCNDIMEAELLIEKWNPQLIFLDIQMPNGSGFDLLDKIKRTHIEVIFVTAYNNFLLKAIRYSALDYIMKPVSISEVAEAVTRAGERLTNKSAMHQLELLLSNIQGPVQSQKIAIPNMGGLTFVSMTDIVRLEAKGAYTEIFINDGKTYLVSRNLKEYENMLPETMFSRVHNTHIVNLQFIKRYQRGNGGTIEMENGAEIEVAVRRREAFLARFK